MPTYQHRIDAARLSRARAARGWTQAELGAAVGADPRTISQYENGHYNASPKRVRAMAEQLRVTTAYLYGEGDQDWPANTDPDWPPSTTDKAHT